MERTAGSKLEMKGLGSLSPMDAAQTEWADRIGAEHIITSGDSFDRFVRCTFQAESRPAVILEPGSREDTAACMQIALKYRLPVHPISGGRNWGYGSSIAPRDGSVILSLARLNRILDFDEELAVVTIEPGVTFRMLTEFLRAQGSGLLPPMTGTTGEASVIGNVLERGVGKGPYEEMASQSFGYEIVLPTGQIVRTGYTGFHAAAVSRLRKHEPGPSLEGLFQQSRYGVVTRMTIALEPAPKWRQRLFFSIPANRQFLTAIEKLRGLLLREGGKSLQAELINDYKMLTMNGQFPFSAIDPGASLPKTKVSEMLGSGASAWYGCITLWAECDEELKWRIKRIKNQLNGSIDAWLFEDRCRGNEVDTYADIRSVYWRKRMLPNDTCQNPDRDNCGVIWLAPVLPMRGDEVSEVICEIEETVLKGGFEPSISLRLVGGRSIQAMIGMMYDREVAGADARAEQCHKSLHERFERKGVYLYRQSLLDQSFVPQRNDDCEEVLRALKTVLDPYHILSPP